jgi:hypothetical protein
MSDMQKVFKLEALLAPDNGRFVALQAHTLWNDLTTA